MKEVTSISGGKTSAFLAAKYPTEYNVFALVRTSDPSCAYPDRHIARMVEDRIQADFVGTLEDDLIIRTIFDLEQFLGREIKWVTGITYDEVIRTKGGWLPNKKHRYCTTWLKIEPIFRWWRERFNQPVMMNIGYRANEGSRVEKMLLKLNDGGLLEFEAIIGRTKNGNRNKWGMIPWQQPNFPLFDNGILKWEIENFWEFKPVKFARLNNCVGCFHRHPMLLRKQADVHPEKMAWFARQESNKKKKWRSDVSYKKIMSHALQFELDFSDFSDCDSGHCEIE